ncbi:MAG TPA: LuxR C-terminal-related transcriptional regulator [Anaeromyxobacteraceae bacterium]|nr:LuxR C-terminal-related transcriptional regulator [Anaeromyxobacteraceae bacterium]
MSQRENAREVGTLERAARTDDGRGRPWVVAAAGGVFLLVAALLCIDYLSDSEAHDARLHAAMELGLMTIAVAAAMVFWSRFVAMRRRERLLSGDLDRARAEAQRWQAEASEILRGLGAAIDTQFERWGLSSAEREVALLLLKGLSHKEIAEVRETSEKTVRQQALAVYRKAGLSGRAELSAFFLEDVLLPVESPVRASRGSGR